MSRVRYCALLVEGGRIESIFCDRNCTLSSIEARAGRESAVLLNFRGERAEVSHGYNRWYHFRHILTIRYEHCTNNEALNSVFCFVCSVA